MRIIIIAGLCLIQTSILHAVQYFSVEEAKAQIFPEKTLIPAPIELTKEQQKNIKKAARVRVRHRKIDAWKTKDNDWFILDEVIGKHENIDIAVGITNEGKIKDIEILVYRETYGDEVRHESWLSQLFGRDHTSGYKLDRDIDGISGATLSSRHVADGAKRLTHTWHQVLQHQ